MADDRFNNQQGASASRWARNAGPLMPGMLASPAAALPTKSTRHETPLAISSGLIGRPGQEHDISGADELINEIKAEAVIADNGYDANTLVARIAKE